MICDRDAATCPEDARHCRPDLCLSISGDELYGQHVHVTLAQAPPAGPYAPTFFTPAEYATLSRLTDVIIPPTSTPGASAAGVPEYIDRVVSLNAEHQPLMRAGLAWLERQAKDRFSREFLSLDDAEHIAILQPLSDEVDRQLRDAQRARFRTEAQGAMVYYVAINDKTSPAPAAATRPAPETDPAQPVRLFRLDQEPDRGRVLHVPRRAARGTGLRRQHARWPATRRARCESTRECQRASHRGARRERGGTTVLGQGGTLGPDNARLSSPV